MSEFVLCSCVLTLLTNMFHQLRSCAPLSIILLSLSWLSRCKLYAVICLYSRHFLTYRIPFASSHPAIISLHPIFPLHILLFLCFMSLCLVLYRVFPLLKIKYKLQRPFVDYHQLCERSHPILVQITTDVGPFL